MADYTKYPRDVGGIKSWAYTHSVNIVDELTESTNLRF